MHSALANSAEPPRVFRFQLGNEPSFIDQADLKAGRGSPLLNQLACPLMRVDGHLKITPQLMKCEPPMGRVMKCQWLTGRTFQDGTAITPQHLLNTLEILTRSDPAPPLAGLLEDLENFTAVRAGKKKLAELGLAVKGNQLTWTFTRDVRPDIALLFTHPILSPRRTATKATIKNWSEYVSCSDYEFEEWLPGQQLTLRHRREQKKIRYLFVEDETKAIALFEQQKLDFVRRVPSALIGKLQARPELLRVDQIRFDAFQFHSREKAWLKAVPQLAQAIDMKQWQSLYFAKPRPGCFGFPMSWADGTVCWDFQPMKDQKWLGPVDTPLRISYSKAGGSDHERSVQFLAETWQNRWGIKVTQDPLEGKIFLEQLKEGRFQMARRGLVAELPGCFATLNMFLKDHPDNILQFDSASLAKLLKQWPQGELRQPQLCRQGLEILRDEAGLIPTGPIFFTHLLRTTLGPQWSWNFSPWGEIWEETQTSATQAPTSVQRHYLDYF